MDNFHIYEEIGRGKSSTVFKGRRKRSVEYVAIKSVDKEGAMEKILHEVQIMYRLKHHNCLKFFNWYETRNHIWLILEYCTGGSLRKLMREDRRLPERSIRVFGADLATALQHLHSSGVLYCDLKPSNVLLNEYGVLKLSDFCLARRMDGSADDDEENGGAAKTNGAKANERENRKKRGTPCYMAPELFSSRGVYSVASDFWALGCVLYEMAFGQPPFVHSDLSKLVPMIQHSPVPHLEKGIRSGDGDGKCNVGISPALRSLISSLLRKDPCDRPTWDALLQHRFWRGIEMPRVLFIPKQPMFEAYVLHRLQTSSTSDKDDLKDDDDAITSESEESAGEKASAHHEESGGALETGDEKLSTEHFVGSMNHADDASALRDRASYAWDVNTNAENAAAYSRAPTRSSSSSFIDQAAAAAESSRGDSVRPKSAGTPRTQSVVPFSDDNSSPLSEASSRPSSAPMRPAASRAFAGNHRGREGRTDAGEEGLEEEEESAMLAPSSNLPTTHTFQFRECARVSDASFGALLHHPREIPIKPIVGNAAVAPLPALRYKADALSFDALVPAEVFEMSNEDLQRFLGSIYNSLNASPSSASGLGRVSHVLGYLFLLCQNSRLANILINSSMLPLLLRLARLRETDVAGFRRASGKSERRRPKLDSIRARVAVVLAVLIRHSTYIAPELCAHTENGLLCVLDMLSKEDAAAKIKRFGMAAFCELIFYIATNASASHAEGSEEAQWRVPATFLRRLLRGIKSNADSSIQRCAVKVIENILVTANPQAGAGGHEAALFLVSHETLVQLRDIAASKVQSRELRCWACNALWSLVRINSKLLSKIAEGEGWSFLVHGLSDDSHPASMRKCYFNIINLILRSQLSEEGESTSNRATRESIFGAKSGSAVHGETILKTAMRLAMLESCDYVLRAKAQLCAALLMRTRYRPLMHSSAAISPRHLQFVDRAVNSAVKGESAQPSQGLKKYAHACLGAYVAELTAIGKKHVSDIMLISTWLQSKDRPQSNGARSSRAKRLATLLLPDLVHLCSSSAVGPRIVCGNGDGIVEEDGESFFEALASLLIVSSARYDDDDLCVLLRQADQHATHLCEIAVQQYLRAIMPRSDYGASVICGKLLPVLLSRCAASSRESLGLDSLVHALRLIGDLVRLYLREGMMHRPIASAEAKMRDLLTTMLFPHCERLLVEPSPVPQMTLRLLYDIVNFKPAYVPLLKSSFVTSSVFSMIPENEPSGKGENHAPPVLAVSLIAKIATSSRADPLDYAQDPYNLFHRLKHVVAHVARLVSIPSVSSEPSSCGESTAAALLEHVVDILHEIVLRVVEAGSRVSNEVTRGLEILTTPQLLLVLSMSLGHPAEDAENKEDTAPPRLSSCDSSTQKKAAACISALARISRRRVAEIFLDKRREEWVQRVLRYLGESLQDLRASDDADEDANVAGVRRSVLIFLQRVMVGADLSQSEAKRARALLRAHKFLWNAMLRLQRHAVDESLSELAEDVLQLAL